MSSVKKVAKSGFTPKIEHDIPLPSSKAKHNFDFGSMKEGDSFKFNNMGRIQAIQSYGLWLAKGTYRTVKEDDGYRFHLLKKIK